MPTLFIAIASVFMDEGDIGLGTIMGSTMFNILFITACCGLCSGLVITLHSWPLVRDSAVYIVHLVALMAALQDNVVHWYESIVFPFLYSGYIVIMCLNTKLEKLFGRIGEKWFNISKGFEMVEMEDPMVLSSIEIKTEGDKAGLQKEIANAEKRERPTAQKLSNENTVEQLRNLEAAQIVAKLDPEKTHSNGNSELNPIMDARKNSEII